MATVFFVLFLLTGILTTDPCRHFQCVDPVDPQQPEVCARLDKVRKDYWIEKVGKCDEGKTCRMNEVDETTMRCVESPDFYKWPGMKCTREDMCYGKRIVDGFCRGKPLGESCESHFDCDVGLRCGLDKKCDPAAEENERCDGEYLLCQSYLSCRENTCTPYGSLPNGHPLGRSPVDLCMSRYKNSHDVCEEGHTLRGAVFVDNTDVLCVYSNQEENRAVCGFHEDGKAICRPGAASLMGEWTDLLEYLKKKPLCHPYFADMGQCDMAITMGERAYLKGRIAYSDLHFFTQLQKVPPCVQKFVHPEYFELKGKYSGAATYSIFIAALVALFLAFLQHPYLIS